MIYNTKLHVRRKRCLIINRVLNFLPGSNQLCIGSSVKTKSNKPAEDGLNDSPRNASSSFLVIKSLCLTDRQTDRRHTNRRKEQLTHVEDLK